MPEERFDPEEAQRLITILKDDDLFRRVIRGWSMIEDAFEQEIDAMLAEPFPFGAAPFHHKLNLAIGLGIVAPELRDPFAALATIRNKLAHGDREAEDISPSEFQEITHGFASEFTWEPSSAASDDAWSEFALSFAWSAVKHGGRVARVTREQEREALRREYENPAFRALLSAVENAISADDERDD
jgi:hypothetical protein